MKNEEGKKKRGIAHLSENMLFEMGDALKIQSSQLDSLEKEKSCINAEIQVLEKNNIEVLKLEKEAESLVNELLERQGELLDGISLGKDIFVKEDKNESCQSIKHIQRIETINTYNNWELYVKEYKNYAKKNNVELESDPFLTLLSQREYEKIQNEINDEFAKKTNIVNKTDLSFLAIATALQTVKALLFPIISQKVGYGEKIDKDLRMKNDDTTIKKQERKSKEKFIERYEKENQDGEWMNILTRSPMYDTTIGSKEIGVNMEGGYHRIHTLGHDPILGWIFGTANILTDTITLDSLETYQGTRIPKKRITTEKVLLSDLFSNTFEKVKEDKLNLPAAIVAEGIHLKSDEFTKLGLPVPVLEAIAPKLAGKLYKQNYDKLCLSRDLKIIGTSAAVSMLIDVIIGLVHALFYDKDRDGTKDMYEVRTRKILLISNTIATASNLVCTAITKNPKNLDIGGLIVTISHLFSDIRFFTNVKREFIENRIYEKIEKEKEMIEENENEIFSFEMKYWM